MDHRDHRPDPLLTTGRAGPEAAPGEAFDTARFAPGAVLAARYRIVALLGSGGMGEVYRADDLTLKQAVALKFLPVRLASDGAALARFHREVSMARRVSHPNVCRVFDIGEADGQPFLSMEYIDGEDLASLLRRIGRLPGDKALEIARQLCGGLAAAHEAGVLHRDLKPANVMLDGRGRVRITDFGLAVASAQAAAEIAGTPAYMSPEQLAGGEVTASSDVYALGLVLYEVFTGKRAFEAPTLAEYARLHQSSQPPSPSSAVTDLDPLVERVIMRCLEKAPHQRPSSALQVAASLPGGDPLQAALAAGETPSPRMVAASGGKTGMHPVSAAGWLAANLVGLVLVAIVASQWGLLVAARFDMPPEVLLHQSREIVSRLGYGAAPVGTASGLHIDTAYLTHLEGPERAASRRARLAESRPAAIHFWYRQSPQALVATYAGGGGRVSPSDPPVTTAGMIGLELEASGYLRSFYAVPPITEEPGGTGDAIDWPAVFALANLDFASFTPIASPSVPRYAHDEQGAWTGTYPGQADPIIEVEASARRGRLVHFEVREPWLPRSAPQTTAGQRASFVFVAMILGVMLLGAALLAWLNLHKGRGDRRGAFRVFAFVTAGWLVVWLLRADHTVSTEQWHLIAWALKDAVFLGGWFWLLYLALEPFVRRRWPTMLVSWSRLLEGEFDDPLVGRDLLLGVGAGIALALLSVMQAAAMGSFVLPSLHAFQGVRHSAGWFLEGVLLMLQISLSVFFIIFLLRVVARREWLAAAVFLLLTLIAGVLREPTPIYLMMSSLSFALMYFVAVRLGLVALAAAIWVMDLLQAVQPLNLTAWHAGYALVPLVAVAVLSVFAFRTALGSRRLLRSSLLDT